MPSVCRADLGRMLRNLPTNFSENSSSGFFLRAFRPRFSRVSGPPQKFTPRIVSIPLHSDPPIPALFAKKARDPRKKQGFSSQPKTLKIPGKEGKNARKSDENRKMAKARKTRKTRIGGSGQFQIFETQKFSRRFAAYGADQKKNLPRLFLRLFLKGALVFRNALSTAGNSMTSSERPFLEPLLQKEESPERILEASHSLNCRVWGIPTVLSRGIPGKL